MKRENTCNKQKHFVLICFILCLFDCLCPVLSSCWCLYCVQCGKIPGTVLFPTRLPIPPGLGERQRWLGSDRGRVESTPRIRYQVSDVLKKYRLDARETANIALSLRWGIYCRDWMSMKYFFPTEGWHTWFFTHSRSTFIVLHEQSQNLTLNSEVWKCVNAVNNSKPHTDVYIQLCVALLHRPMTWFSVQKTVHWPHMKVLSLKIKGYS